MSQVEHLARGALQTELSEAGFASVAITVVPIERRFSRAHALDRIRGRYARR